MCTHSFSVFYHNDEEQPPVPCIYKRKDIFYGVYSDRYESTIQSMARGSH